MHHLLESKINPNQSENSISKSYDLLYLLVLRTNDVGVTMLSLLISLLPFALLKGHEVIPKEMRTVLKGIETLSNQANNPCICEELDHFLSLEVSLKSVQDNPFSDESLGDIFTDLKFCLQRILKNQREIVEAETEKFFSEAIIFNQVADLVLSAQNSEHSTQIGNVNYKLNSQMSDYAFEINMIRSKINDAIYIVGIVVKVLLEHPEWEELMKECHVIQEKQMMIDTLLLTARAKIQAIKDTMMMSKFNIVEDRDYSVFQFPEDELQKLTQSVEDVELTSDHEGKSEKKEWSMEIIRYDSIKNPQKYEVADATYVPRIKTKFISREVIGIAADMAKARFKVLMVQQKEDPSEPFAELHENLLVSDGVTIGVLKMSPLHLSNHPEFWDKHATNSDGKIIINVRGHKAMKDRMFFPFHVAVTKDFDTIVIDCNFGSEHPYLNNPQNLSYTYLAATAAYSNTCMCQFILAGDLNNEFCEAVLNTIRKI
jgi:hypothetical protein